MDRDSLESSNPSRESGKPKRSKPFNVRDGTKFLADRIRVLPRSAMSDGAEPPTERSRNEKRTSASAAGEEKNKKKRKNAPAVALTLT